MCAGVGLFGTFAGYLAAWFIGSPESQAEKPALPRELASLREEVKGLREELRGLREAMAHIAGEG
jgi:hypothetical protein